MSEVIKIVSYICIKDNFPYKNGFMYTLEYTSFNCYVIYDHNGVYIDSVMKVIVNTYDGEFEFFDDYIIPNGLKKTSEIREDNINKVLNG